MWKATVRCKTKTTPLGKHLTSVDAELFAISAMARKAGPLLEKSGQRSADNVSLEKIPQGDLEGQTVGTITSQRYPQSHKTVSFPALRAHAIVVAR